MKQAWKRILPLLLAAVLLLSGSMTAEARSKKKRTATPKAQTTASPTPAPTAEPSAEILVEEDGEYSDKEHVAAYLRAFHHLPANYITKREAQDLGWVSSWGNLWEVAPGKSIGGDRFGNYEGSLPDARGRKWFECDIDYDPEENRGKRNSKRIVFSSDGLIYYTEDHYTTFEDLTEANPRAGP